jgi:hypothetical protein
MNIEALRALVEQRRSIRGYDEKRDVTDEMIHRETYDMSKFRDDAMMEKFVKTLTLQGSYGKGH